MEAVDRTIHSVQYDCMAENTWHLPSKYYEHIFVSGLHPVPPSLPKKEKLGKGTGVGMAKKHSLRKSIH